MNRVALRRALATPALRQPLLLGRPLTSALNPHARAVSTVADVSFWRSLVPKPLRSTKQRSKKPNKVQKGWNPATFFIIIFLLIGSMAIQMITLRKDFATFMRQSGVRIEQLREVVEKLQRGEEVDVEKALGTGDPDKELDWEQVLREIEREEPTKNQRKKQPEPVPNPTSTSEPDGKRPSSQEARAPLQSTLASKGFF
ncbi:hypothetical protein C7999DRAFT_35466 [Corynascus novoguineensis]|uniref:Uncharacterized protein n=1 Tax=Corynascus novoguineensis TaxID=1126955 RepID=A0AAN7CLC7_9PEZI|nr:hypothetical protein C7999DRAFT_35466 [Corynascus novoguineensis]